MTSEYEIAFALLRGMSVDLARKILDVVESEQNFFALKQSELEGIIGAKNRILESAYRNEILEKARREMEFVNANSIDLYYFRDAAFPQRMLDAIDAPILLFGKGPVNLNAARLVSVVGTRHATQYGKAITDKIIGELAKMYPDVMIVSGLAYGIDVAAHRASLAHSVATIAILGHGLNTIYPAQHRSVAVDMLRHNGALLSEYT
ncbi:MAG: DNA-processing protein DprA, partial [Muribaculaceae bacterium]